MLEKSKVIHHPTNNGPMRLQSNITINPNEEGFNPNYQNSDKAFIRNNIGNAFKAARHNVNFWKTECGHMIHVYDAIAE